MSKQSQNPRTLRIMPNMQKNAANDYNNINVDKLKMEIMQDLEVKYLPPTLEHLANVQHDINHLRTTLGDGVG
jgi:hypothetical protein